MLLDTGKLSFLKLKVAEDKEEIEDILRIQQESPGARYAQTRLAEETTKLVHGDAAMNSAKQATDCLTGLTNIAEAGDGVLVILREEIPSVHAEESGSIIDALVATGLASSNSEARRLITGNAISLNGAKVSREQFEPADFQNGRILLRRGKAYKDSALVELG